MMNAKTNETAIEKEDYRFSVDIAKTAEYYRTHALCDCSACRNFYRQIKDSLPNACAWLEAFGADITRPDETMWIQNDDKTISYDACYTVCGRISAYGKYEFDFRDSVFTCAVITDPKHDGNYFPNEQQGDYFGIVFYNITLPWILDEPFPEEDRPEKRRQPFRLFKLIKNWFIRD